ncbi:type II toxin-antitoxin system HicA family toxin [Chloracidobacterium sp. D]|uniref:type II toxin-antitoxin system HicA family toxin n=1 Tax=Chloracidobacterium sp. D TaxID=2821536 RepID=UPI001B8BBFFE|nr:type II toxin-antitoxin system HicA family toxin [Chloracidobacterium sp. D]QUV81486.1 type II toxin-antitoxin system HicA family toxin [Chloracidobacterium sp. D]
MTKLPRVKGQELIAALHKAGFDVVRIKGSHHFLRHSDGRCTVIPVHRGETIGPGLMSKILRDCEITSEALLELL